MKTDLEIFDGVTASVEITTPSPKKYEMREDAVNLLRLHKFPSKSISIWAEKTLENKKLIREIYGLNAENNYRILADIPGSNLFQEFLKQNDGFESHIRSYISDTKDGLGFSISKMSFIDNTLSYYYYTEKEGDKKIKKTWEGKLSKILSKMTEDNPSMQNILKIMNNSGYFDHPITSKNWVTDLNSLNKSMKVFVSANPEDFLINSNLDWSNCYRLNGGHNYRNAGITLGLSPNVLICGVVDSVRRFEDKKWVDKKYIGRFWTYILFENNYNGTPIDAKGRKDIPFIALQKNYGSIPTEHKYLIENILKSGIEKYFGVSNSWKTVSTGGQLKNVDYVSHVYFDNGNITQYSHTDSALKSSSYYKMSLTDAICLHCGTHVLKIEEFGICNSCLSKIVRCNCCGIVMSEKTEYSIIKGNPICNTCAKTKFHKCEICGTLEMDRNMKEVNDVNADGDKIKLKACNNCSSKLFGVCNSCGEFHKKSSMIMTEEKSNLCEGCTKTSAFKCPECGKIHLKTNGVILSHLRTTVCKKCSTTKFFKCEVCGELEFSKHMTRIDYAITCRNCISNTDTHISCRKCGKTHLRTSPYVLISHNNKDAYCVECAKHSQEEGKLKICPLCNDYTYKGKPCGCGLIALPIFEEILANKQSQTTGEK